MRSVTKFKIPLIKAGAVIAGGALSYQFIPKQYKTDVKEILSRQLFSTGFTLATQPISVPVLNLLIAKVNNESYGSALMSRLANNPADLYQSTLQNTYRRSCGSIPSSVIADYLTNKYGYDKQITAIFATIIETSLSLSLGEIGEKRQIVKKAAESYGGFYSEKGFQHNKCNGSIISAITLRNGLFMAATFAVEPLAEFICEITNNSFSQNQIAGALRYAFTIASVVPENIANNLVMGRSIQEIMFDKDILKSLTRGALARGIYGALASWSIATGLNLAKKARENDNLDLQDFYIAIKEQLDVLLLREKSSPEEYIAQSHQIADFIDQFFSANNRLHSLDYHDTAVELSMDAMKKAADSFKKHLLNISYKVSECENNEKEKNDDEKERTR